MDVAAIIVNYYSSTYLSELVIDLQNQHQIQQILLVDNSGEIERCDGVEIIKPSQNIGFAGGVNLAASKTNAEYILLINPDVKLFPGCLYHLLTQALRYHAVLTGPRFFWDEAKKYKLPPSQGSASQMDYACGASSINRLDFEHLSFYWQIRHERFWNNTTPFVELFLSGACMLVHRPWAMKNNLDTIFDSRFFLYFEDNDLSLRAYFDGMPPLCVPEAQALHYYNQSPSPGVSKQELMEQSHAQFIEKYSNNMKYSCQHSGYYCPQIQDLGIISSPFACDVETIMDPYYFMTSYDNLYLEIGINPFFVPFVQTSLLGNTRFEMEIFLWNRLANGIYYTRIRSRIKGTIKIWKWQKI